MHRASDLQQLPNVSLAFDATALESSAIHMLNKLGRAHSDVAWTT